MDDLITQVPIHLLRPSPFNPRKTVNEAALRELATDIRSQGILSPLLVRPLVYAEGLARRTDGQQEDGDTRSDILGEGFEVVFGHRRLQGGHLAGLSHLPCMVRMMSDVEARRAQVSENLSREDVHPIEEAEGYQALIDDGSETADTLAHRYGKSRSYIYARLKLLQACPPIRTACLAGDIGSEVALLISRLRTDKLQQKALGYIEGKFIDLKDGGRKSYRAIRDLLREKFTLTLNRGGKDPCLFDPADPTLVPAAGACDTCPRRSGNAPEYEDIAQDSTTSWNDRRPGNPNLCTDPDCYGAKRGAHLAAAAAALEAKGKQVITGNKARAAVDARGDIKGAYIALADVRKQVSEANVKSTRQGATRYVDIVTVQDPRSGKTIEAVRRADLQAAGIPIKADAQASASAAQQRRQEAETALYKAQAEAESARRLALLHRTRQAIRLAPRSSFDLRLIAAALLNHIQYHDRDILADLLQVESISDITAKDLDALSPDALSLLLLDCAICINIEVDQYDLKHKRSPCDALTAAARHYGIDPDAPADATKADPAAVQTPAPPPDPPHPPAARAAKPAPAGVKYHDPLTDQTWSGRGLQPAWLKARLASGRTLADFAAAPTPSTAAPAAPAPTPPGGPQESQTHQAGSAGDDQTDEGACAARTAAALGDDE
jgi:ParB/RepB/Spo0J family partition protein